MSLCGRVSVAHASEPPTEALLWPAGHAANLGDEPRTVDSPEWTERVTKSPTLTTFLPDAERRVGAAVVICPGGGYSGLAMQKEGLEVAEWLRSQGIVGVVLRYRCGGGKNGQPVPLDDAQRAVRTVRAQAPQWGVDPHKIGILGFSAGGHLASTAATMYDYGRPDADDPIERQSSRPDFAVLVYPVITLVGETAHRGSRNNLLGADSDDKLAATWSTDRRVTDKTPPTFLVHASDDEGVPVENSLLFYRALVARGVPAALHVYEAGGHGFGMFRGQRPADRWPDQLRDWLQARGVLPAATAPVTANSKPSRIEITPEHVLSVNGTPTFPIGFTMPPAPEARTPDGRPALAELRQAGATFIRTGPMRDFDADREHAWNDDWLAREQAYMDAAALAGMHCMPWLKELAEVEAGDAEQEERLRRVIHRFRDHPGMGVWKGADEPQWGQRPVESLKRAYDIVRREDPNHPVWIVQAPRGTVDELKPYNAAYDIGGVDVYPIGYPPGRHLEAHETNRTISMIGDYAQKMHRVVDRRQPIWFTLQIAWSGVAGKGKTLRFPTFHEQRFMTYQAIINGARGLVYFGGALPMTLAEDDRPHGWNWRYWLRVLRPVIEEVGDRGPLAAALCAPESKAPVRVAGRGIEFCVREAGDSVFILACCREPQETAKATFSGLPGDLSQGEVLYESPRTVSVRDGAFTDWFAPYDVHVYRFQRDVR